MPAPIIIMVSMQAVGLLGTKGLGVLTWGRYIAMIEVAEELFAVMDIASVCPIKGKVGLRG